MFGKVIAAFFGPRLYRYLVEQPERVSYVYTLSLLNGREILLVPLKNSDIFSTLTIIVGFKFLKLLTTIQFSCDEASECS